MALPTNELLAHPRGQITIAGGQLQSATLGRFTLKNGATLKSTLAKNPSGVVLGNLECDGTIDTDVSEKGPEKDWVRMVKQGVPQKFSFELPTLNVEIEGVLSQIEVEVPLDNAVKITASFVGKVKDPVI